MWVNTERWGTFGKYQGDYSQGLFYLSSCCCLVTQLCPVLCDPMNCKHARPHCPSHPPRACSNSHSLTRWCHPNISSSVAPFSSCPQFFPASGSFLVSQLFTTGSQSIGASASASVLLMNIQGWFPLGLTGWSPCCPRDSQESFLAPQFENINSSALSLLYSPTFPSLLEPQLWLYSPLSAEWCLCFLIGYLGLS